MKELPKNLELERSVAGLIAQDYTQYDQIANILNAECFTDTFCRSIFEAVQYHDKKSLSYDQLIISQYLAEKTGKKTAQIFVELSEVERSIKSYSNTHFYGATLKELSLRRVTYQKIGKYAYRALDMGVDIFETIAEINKTVAELEGGIQSDTIKPISDIIPTAIEEIEKAGQSNTGVSGLPTMIHAIDQPISGLNEGKLIVIAGRPAMGKTALCLSAMLNLSVYQSVPSLFLSLEMPETELVKRLICNHCDIEGEAIKTGKLSEPQYNKLHGNLQALIGSEIFIDDKAGVNLIQIKSKIRQAVKKHSVKVVFIDYLQLIHMDNSNRNVSIGEITTSLKEMAKEYKIPIVLLSQLSRKCEERADKRPMLSDLRESGSIEQDADAVAFVYRDVIYDPEPKDASGNRVEPEFSELIWAKNREGSIGINEMSFTGDRFRFGNYKPTEINSPF